MRTTLLAALLVLCVLDASASELPYLVKDINTNVASYGSSPDYFKALGNIVFFTPDAGYGSYTFQLWRTDGTDAGTYVVADGGYSKVVWQNKLWFIGSVNTVIGSTDGTVAGTTTFTLPPSVTAAALMPGPDHLYFMNSGALWRTDGTADTTVKVADGPFLLPNTGQNDGSATSVVLGSSIYFIADVNKGGMQLWRADANGAAMVSAVAAPDGYGEYLAQLMVYGNTLYFEHLRYLYGYLESELWRSDGTAAGTFKIRKTAVTPIVSSGGWVYFVGTDATSGQGWDTAKLWRTDGTLEGSSVVATSLPGGDPTFLPGWMTALGNGTILIGGYQNSLSSDGVWSFDGTNFTLLTSSQSLGGVVPAASYGILSREGHLWRTDGTVSGTFQINALGPSERGVAIGDTIFFTGSDGTHGSELWKTGGTIATTSLVKDIIAVSWGSYPNLLRSFRNGVLFMADETITGDIYTLANKDLWFSDGTDGGTQKVLAGAGPLYEIVPCGDRAYFARTTSDAGNELWSTDGTAAGTSMVVDLYPGSTASWPNGSNPHGFACMDGTLFFLAISSPSTFGWWRSDGTANGTLLMKDLVAVNNVYNLSRPAIYDHRLYLGINDQLWRTDGTPAGTGVFASNFAGLLPATGQYLFFSTRINERTSLWRTDGTTGGTTSFLTSQYLPMYSLFNGRVAFGWVDNSFARGLCTSSGSADDVVCFDTHLSASGWWDFMMQPLNGRLYYNFPELYSTDGTNVTDSGIGEFDFLRAAAGGRFYFMGNTSAYDGYRYLYETDGTLAGTRKLMANDTDEAAASGGRVFFGAEELYALNMDVTPTSFAPEQIGTDGGDVTITGRGFTTPVTVTVGGVAAAVTSSSDTSIVFTAPPMRFGTYNVSLTLGDGRQMSLDKPLAYICTAPTAVIGPAPAAVCPMQPAALQGSGGSRCAWFPGAGLDDPSSCTPHATVSTTTTYKLMVFDDTGCPSTNDPSVTVTVYPPPDATITLTATTVLPNHDSTLSVPDAGPGATYLWSGSAITSDPTLRSVTIHPACVPDTFSVSVTVTSPHGCPASATRQFFYEGFGLSPSPSVSPTLAAPGTLMRLSSVEGFTCVTDISLFTSTTRPVPFNIVDDATITFTMPSRIPTSMRILVTDAYGHTRLTFNTVRREERGDVNGDSRADLVWRNATTGATSVWLMNGPTVAGGSGLTNLQFSDNRFTPAGTGDFNGDGKSDLVWRDTTTGETIIWMMSGTNAISGSGTLAVIPPPWQITGIGDFNGDAKADLLWRNSTTGQNAIWLLDSLNVLPGSGEIFGVPDTNWSVAGVGDFNGDGRADILWRNSSTGMTSIWMMNGGVIGADSGVTSLQISFDWRVAAVGDFNNDGYADIMWRNASTGDNILWLQNGLNTITGSGWLPTVPDTNWNVVASGDFGGDGRADLVWRNAITGETSMWLLSGTTLSSSSGPIAVVPLPWQVAGPK